MIRDGNFRPNAKNLIFFIWQITVLSVTECVKSLLNSGLKFVLAEKCNQGVVKEYFGRQRHFIEWNETPTSNTRGEHML